MDQVAQPVIRPCTLDDLGWLLAMALAAYPSGTFNLDDGRDYLMALLKTEAKGTISARGDHSAAFAFVLRTPWKPDVLIADLSLAFSARAKTAPLEIVSVIRFLAKRAFDECGCDRFYITSDIADLTPVAKRLGARRAGMVYVLEKADV